MLTIAHVMDGQRLSATGMTANINPALQLGTGHYIRLTIDQEVMHREVYNLGGGGVICLSDAAVNYCTQFVSVVWNL